MANFQATKVVRYSPTARILRSLHAGVCSSTLRQARIAHRRTVVAGPSIGLIANSQPDSRRINWVAVAPCSGFHYVGWNFSGGDCTFNGLMVTACVLKDSEVYASGQVTSTCRDSCERSQTAGRQRCRSRSSIRLAGWVGKRLRTSRLNQPLGASGGRFPFVTF